MRQRLLAIGCCLCIFSAYAGPPFLTDDADPTDYKNYELYLFEQSDKNHEEVNVAFPAIELDYGAMENLQIDMTIPFISNRPTSNERKNAFGIGDIEFGFKYRFITETTVRPEVVIAPAFTLPTGSRSRGLGNGSGIQQIPLWVEKNWKEWELYGGGGYTFNTGNDNKNYWYGGIVVEHEFNDYWMGGLELYAQGASEKDLGSVLLLNLGGSFNLSKNASILFSAGHSIKGENHTITYVAFYLTGD